MPESLPESLNLSASIDSKSAKLFVAPASQILIFEGPIQITFPNSFGTSKEVC